jgi:hypothetical protein
MAGPSRSAPVDEPDIDQPSRPARPESPSSLPAIQARARKKGRRR